MHYTSFNCTANLNCNCCRTSGVSEPKAPFSGTSTIFDIDPLADLKRTEFCLRRSILIKLQHLTLLFRIILVVVDCDKVTATIDTSVKEPFHYNPLWDQEDFLTGLVTLLI